MKIKKFKVIGLENQMGQKVLPGYVELGNIVSMFVNYDSSSKRETFILTADTEREYHPLNNDHIHFTDKAVLERYFKLVE